MTSPGANRVALRLVADGALQLVLDRGLYALAERWIPQRLGGGEPSAGASRAVITVGASGGGYRRPAGPATLALGGVGAWVDDRRGVVVLRGALPSSGGVLSFSSGRARLGVDPAQAGDAAADLYSMLTVAAALLLAGLGRALVHAAAVVASDGRAWLLAGDARSGKSTTCATLARGGWGYLSDDQVVLTLTGDEIEVEGWLRPFHLDALGERGGGEGEPSGRRCEVHSTELGLAGWRRTAPFGGAIFPLVRPHQPTRLAPVGAAQALTGLVRQSPWLLAHGKTAPVVLALLRRAVAKRRFSLRLGRDTYREPARLAACLRGLESVASHTTAAD